MRTDDLPAPLRGRPFLRRTAIGLGVPSALLSDPMLQHPFHGVHSLQEVRDQLDLCSAYAIKMRPDAYFGGLTAARLWGMWLPPRLDSDLRVRVWVPHGRGVPRGRGVVGHRSSVSREHVRMAWELPILDHIECWASLATELDVEELTIAADSLLQPHVADPELVLRRMRAAAARRRYGRAASAVALERARPRSRSPRESRLRLLLAAAGLPEPEVNTTVTDREGRPIGEADLVYRKERVLCEYEGDQHRIDRTQFRRDIRTRGRYEDEGWKVIRVVADDLDVQLRSEALVARVRRALTHGRRRAA